MTYNLLRVRHYLKEHRFERLFVEELGWNRHAGELHLTVDDHDYTLTAVAEKLGVQVWRCGQGPDGAVAPRAARQKIEKLATQNAYEHLIIYEDAASTAQIWQWVLRRPGEPARYREDTFHKGQTGDLIAQKLGKIAFTLKDEEKLDLFGVVARLRDAFDRDKVTKQFYDAFRAEHGHFLTFIKGIAEQSDREWYASVMLNRLMFVYFIQQKGFLDGDSNYLPNRLVQVRDTRGPDQFYSFYQHFLRRLFHEGFGQQSAQRAPELEQLLGKVPYLNGGLFEPHELERAHPGIDISDEAFERLFDFFGQWQWHLDDRPLAGGREINPDVLGYIFEKYINQKQMGAYYTKEDITGYICKSTIVPHLFDEARKHCAVAFEPNAAVWRLLQQDPDRYIYEPVRRGVIRSDGTELPETELPDFVQVGMHDPQARMFDRRYNLGQADLQDTEGQRLTLPTETWREYVVRRTRCLELRAKLADGDVCEINDLVTLNLDLRQFAQDAIEQCEGPDQLRAFWKSANSMTVLDPACGSGAFLFAALNILEPVYDACLDRMQAFVDDLDGSGEAHSPRKFEDLRTTLRAVDRHPNRDYFILKSIMVNNLYGVDIMPEAVEICKLRLFLKLVAQVDRVEQLEPLPDIDFNIRAGNTLIGYASIDEIRQAAAHVPVTAKDPIQAAQFRYLDPETDAVISRIEEDAELVDRAFTKFHEMQSVHDMDAEDFATAKGELRKRLDTLSAQLDQYLAREYGVEVRNDATFEGWQRSHQPFHWIAEFFGIMRGGGFSVVIGNPPYVNYGGGRVGYSVRDYVTAPCGNLYAFLVERSIRVSDVAARIGKIIMLNVTFGDDYQSLRDLVMQNSQHVWLSSYDNIPDGLFSSSSKSELNNTNRVVSQRVAIVIAHRGMEGPAIHSTDFLRWNRAYRSVLFPCVQYGSRENHIAGTWPALGSVVSVTSFDRLWSSDTHSLGSLITRHGLQVLQLGATPRYFISAVPESLDRAGVVELRFITSQDQEVAEVVLNSDIFLWYWRATGDGFHLTRSCIEGFPVPSSLLSLADELSGAVQRLKTVRTRCRTSKLNKGRVVYNVNYNLAPEVLWSIDRLLATHYGFTDEELDFIINYDIKYRMGSDVNTVIDS